MAINQKRSVYPVFRDHWGVFPMNLLADKCAERYGENVFLKNWNGHSYDEITFTEFASRVRSISRWLVGNSIREGDKVAILADNSPEWGMAYLGILGAGAVVVPVDRLMAVKECRNIIEKSGSRLLFSSSIYIEQLEEMDPVPTLETIVSFDDSAEKRIIAWNHCLESFAEESITLPDRNLEDLAAILFTSGTTGSSKGVMLSHGNIMSNVAATAQMTDLGPGDNFLALMPMHHAYQCTNGFLHPLYIGSTITFARRLRSAEILMDIKDSSVTALGAVPLLFEKFKAGILRNVKNKGNAIQLLFNLFMLIVVAGEKVKLHLGRFVFRRIRQKASMGNMKYFITGGAPMDPETSKFFSRFGIPMLQGFGITEASPLTHFTPPSNIRHECVGLPIPELECKIDQPGPDGVGELLLKGPNIFMGYYENEKATREAFTPDGWFKTGDLGIIHPDGFLQITGRKKNLIVTAGGKNVYPEEIEHYLNRSPLIEESMVIGITRESGYGQDVGALIFPNYEELEEAARMRSDPLDEQAIYGLLKEELNRLLVDQPQYKKVRKFRVQKEEFAKTSTRKLKRYLYSQDMADL